MADVSSFWAPIHKKVEESHAKEEAAKTEWRRGLQSIFTSNDPEVSDGAKNKAYEDWTKSLHPEIRKQVVAQTPIISKIWGVISGQKQKPKAAASSPTPAPTGPVFDAASADKRELYMYGKKADIDANKQKSINASKPGTSGTARTVRAKAGGKEMDLQFDPKQRKFYTLQGEEFEPPDDFELVKVEKPGTMRREYFTYPGDPDQTPHLVYVDPKDPKKRLDAETQKAPPEGALPFNMEEHIAKVRGSQYGTGMFNSLFTALKSQGYTDEDAKQEAGRVTEENIRRATEMKGATTVTERPMVVGGEVKAVPFERRTVPRPMSGPVRGLTAPVPSATPQGTPAAVPPATTPKPAPQGGPRPAPAPAAAGGGRTVGVPPAQYRAMLNDIRSVRGGAGQLFGDPNVPSVKGLVEYGDLADDKGSKERLGLALRLTFEGLDQNTAGGHAGISGGGAALNVGGIGTFVGNILGIPTQVADQQAKMLQSAVSALTPREREAYNATIASAEGIIGLRRITGASPSQQSVRAIQEAMPIIGVNTTDKKQFDDKAQRLAVEFSAGTRGLPRGGFDAETLKQIDEINALPERLTKRSGPKAAPAASTPTVKTKSEFDALPKGAEYIGKDGKKYRKP